MVQDESVQISWKFFYSVFAMLYIIYSYMLLIFYIVYFFGSDDSQQESFVLNVSGINFYKMKIIINNKLKLHVLQKIILRYNPESAENLTFMIN